MHSYTKLTMSATPPVCDGSNVPTTLSAYFTNYSYSAGKAVFTINADDGTKYYPGVSFPLFDATNGDNVSQLGMLEVPNLDALTEGKTQQICVPKSAFPVDTPLAVIGATSDGDETDSGVGLALFKSGGEYHAIVGVSGSISSCSDCSGYCESTVDPVMTIVNQITPSIDPFGVTKFARAPTSRVSYDIAEDTPVSSNTVTEPVCTTYTDPATGIKTATCHIYPLTD